MRTRIFAAAASLTALAVAGLMPAPVNAAAANWSVDLRADNNRDGSVDVRGLSDEAVETTSTALVLPNLDDDSNRCPEQSGRGKPLTSKQLAACFDAADGEVNGATDALDLAPVRLLPNVDIPGDASATATVSGAAHLFVNDGTTWRRVTENTHLTAGLLRGGLTLGVEATAPRSKTWDGVIEVTVTATSTTGTSSDVLRLQAAPLVTHHHLQAAQQVLVSNTKIARGPRAGKTDPWQVGFNRNLTKLVRAAGVPDGVRELGLEEWQQDYVEPMYAAVPSGAGIQSMRVLLRSDQERSTQLDLYQLRGPDVGVLWLGKAKHYSSLSSFGNLETIPPYPGHPAGRIIWGERSINGGTPSVKTRDLLAAQGAGQDPLMLDVSFLTVGHVDEFIQFVPADNTLGWKIAIADPRAALNLLRAQQKAGNGDVIANPLTPYMRNAKQQWDKANPGQDPGLAKPMTVDQALRRGRGGAIAPNDYAAKIIEKNLRRVLAATGATEADVIRVPVLFEGPQVLWTSGAKKGQVKSWTMTSTMPDVVNNLVLGKTLIVAKPYGMKVGGRFVFADAVRDVYKAEGLKVRYLDDGQYQSGGGDVHCATNTLRAMTPWW